MQLPIWLLRLMPVSGSMIYGVVLSLMILVLAGADTQARSPSLHQVSTQICQQILAKFQTDHGFKSVSGGYSARHYPAEAGLILLSCHLHTPDPVLEAALYQQMQAAMAQVDAHGHFLVEGEENLFSNAQTRMANSLFIAGAVLKAPAMLEVATRTAQALTLWKQAEIASLQTPAHSYALPYYAYEKASLAPIGQRSLDANHDASAVFMLALLHAHSFDTALQKTARQQALALFPALSELSGAGGCLPLANQPQYGYDTLCDTAYAAWALWQAMAADKILMVPQKNPARTRAISWLLEKAAKGEEERFYPMKYKGKIKSSEAITFTLAIARACRRADLIPKLEAEFIRLHQTPDAYIQRPGGWAGALDLATLLVMPHADTPTSALCPP